MIYPYVKVNPNIGGMIYQCDGVFLAGFLASQPVDNFCFEDKRGISSLTSVDSDIVSLQ
jgi:hypothetical protein